jgi:hypothetical protein
MNSSIRWMNCEKETKKIEQIFEREENRFCPVVRSLQAEPANQTNLFSFFFKKKKNVKQTNFLRF